MMYSFLRACSLRFSLVVLVFFQAPAFAQNLDISLLRHINVERNRSLDGTMKVITASDFPIAVAIPITELIVGYTHHDKQAIINGVTTIAAMGLNTVVTFGLKYAVDRHRPYVIYPDVQPYKTFTDASFPSGHSSIAFCSATCISMLYPRWYVVVPAYTWATAVGYSRMHLGVHYPSDVLVGGLVGSASAWLTVKGSQWLQRRYKANREMQPL